MSWTEQSTSTLKKLWLEGQSASQIAKQLPGITRNAVIGKVHRLGLSARNAPSAPAGATYRPPRHTGAPRRAAPALRPEPARAATPVPEVAPPPPRIELPGTATLMTLGKGMCKWPIGDPATPQFSFCGRAGEPFCTEHGRVAYQPAKKKSGADELARSLRRYI